MRTTAAVFVLWNIFHILYVEAIHVLIQTDDMVEVFAAGKLDQKENVTKLVITGDVALIKQGLPTVSDLSTLLGLINNNRKLDNFLLATRPSSDSTVLTKYSVNQEATLSTDSSQIVVNITLQISNDECVVYND